MNLVVRPATVEDLRAVARLLADLPLGAQPRQDAEPNTRQASLWLGILDQPGRTLLVADRAGAVVGTADVIVIQNISHEGAPWAIVENVMVLGSNRRTGVGRALMEKAVAIARESGCYKVQLLSNRARVEAHEFYKAIGFEPSAEGFRLYLDG